jgi:hypothetical protein
MSLKYCQGPKCHTYTTQDRLKGIKGSKTFQTRRRSNLYYGDYNFCSLNCQNDWFKEFGNQAIDQFGRLTFPLKLTEQNAWVKDYNYTNGWGSDKNYIYLNKITKEQRPLTKAQYEDNNYTLNSQNS